MQHSEKTAVITGATQGIGKAIAEKLLSENFSVIICARSAGDLRQCKADWEQKFPAARVHIFVADFSQPEQVNAFAQYCLERTADITMLVNNAGIFHPGSLATEPEGQLESMMQVNVYAAYHLTRALLPVMKEAQTGHIFNLCSVASLKAYPNGGSYSVTKYALMGFSDNLRYELTPFRIRVTAICPGATWSRSWSGSGVPEERIMKAADVADILWASYSLSAQANVDTIVLRPSAGDL